MVVRNEPKAALQHLRASQTMGGNTSEPDRAQEVLGLLFLEEAEESQEYRAPSVSRSVRCWQYHRQNRPCRAFDLCRTRSGQRKRQGKGQKQTGTHRQAQSKAAETDQNQDYGAGEEHPRLIENEDRRYTKEYPIRPRQS